MKDEPRSLKYAKGRTIGDVKNLLSSLLSDIIEGNVTPKTANAVGKKAMDYAMGKRLKDSAAPNPQSQLPPKPTR